MYFQMSLRSRFAVAESVTLANAFQLSSANFFSGFGLEALHIKVGYPTGANVVQPQSNVSPQTIELQRAAVIAISQQPERLAYNLTGGLIFAFADLVLDESFQLRGEGDIHVVNGTPITKNSNICYDAATPNGGA
jgi:hypothetical protein